MPETAKEFITKDITIREFEAEGNKIEGYLSLYGDDLYGDTMAKGCFDSFVNRGVEKLPMLHQHDHKLIVGYWSDFKVNSKGLRAKGTVLEDINGSEDVKRLIKEGLLDGISIGFYPIEYDTRDDWSYEIRDIDLREASIVLIPAVPNARIDKVKQAFLKQRSLKSKGEFKLPETHEAITKDDIKGVVDKALESVGGDIDKAITKQMDGVNKDVEGLKTELSDKASEIEAVKSEVAEKIKSVEILVAKKVDTINMARSNTPVLDGFRNKQWETGGGVDSTHKGIKANAHDLFKERAVVTVDSTNGARQGQRGAYGHLLQSDEIMPHCDIYQADAATFQYPRAGVGSFAAETSVPAQSAVTFGGTIADVDIANKNYTNYAKFSMASFRDVDGLRLRVADLMMQSMGASTAGLAAAAIKASAKSGTANVDISSVDTGKTADTDLPTAAEAVSRCRSMLEGTPERYRRGAIWMMGRQLYSLLLGAENTNARPHFDQTLGLTSLFGFPVYITDAFGNVSAKNDVMGVFGNFMRGIMYSFYEDYTLTEFTETEPGNYVYRAFYRGAVTVIEGPALTALVAVKK